MALDLQNPRRMLAFRLYELTNSAAFSWRAASALHSFYPPDGEGRRVLTAPQRAVIASASGLMLHAFNGSEDEAYLIALAVGRFSGCRTDHTAEFLRRLSTFADRSPGFASMALEGFPERTTDSSILMIYARTFFLLHAKGGEGPALSFAELFSHVGRFPESAKAMADSLSFCVKNTSIPDLAEFMDSFSKDWMRALGSEVFRDNPPD